MDIFESCRTVNDLLNQDKENDARNELIKILDFHEENQLEYTELVNHLIIGDRFITDCCKKQSTFR